MVCQGGNVVGKGVGEEDGMCWGRLAGGDAGGGSAEVIGVREVMGEARPNGQRAARPTGGGGHGALTGSKAFFLGGGCLWTLTIANPPGQFRAGKVGDSSGRKPN